MDRRWSREVGGKVESLEVLPTIDVPHRLCLAICLHGLQLEFSACASLLAALTLEACDYFTRQHPIAIYKTAIDASTLNASSLMCFSRSPSPRDPALEPGSISSTESASHRLAARGLPACHYPSRYLDVVPLVPLPS